MRVLFTVSVSVMSAAFGVWLSQRLIPAGTAQLCAQIGSVIGGFAIGFGGFKVLPP